MGTSKFLKKVLKESQKQNRKLYGPDYRLARLRQLKVLPGTRGFYTEAAAFLAASSFKRLGDFRIATMPRNTPAWRTPLRIYLSPDRQSVACAYYFQAPLQRHVEMGMSGLPMPLTLDLITEFQDGGFLETSNAEAASFVEVPKSVARVFTPAYTPLPKILAAHRKELARLIKAGRRPVLIPDQATMEASAYRMHALKSAFRAKVGHGTMKEIKAIKKRGDDTADALADALGELLKSLGAESAEPPRRRRRA